MSLDRSVAELLEKVRGLSGEERRVYEYFVKYVSVGDLRAVLDLERLGVKRPQDVIDRLVGMGILERGTDCYNLARPLREARKRRLL